MPAGDFMPYKNESEALSALLLRSFQGRNISPPKGRITKADIMSVLGHDDVAYDMLTGPRHDEIFYDFVKQASFAGIDAMNRTWEAKDLSLLQMRALLMYEQHASTPGLQLDRCIGSWAAKFLLKQTFDYKKRLE